MVPDSVLFAAAAGRVRVVRRAGPAGLRPRTDADTVYHDSRQTGLEGGRPRHVVDGDLDLLVTFAPGTSLLDYKGFQLDLEGRMAAGVPSVPFRMVGVVQVNVVV